MGVKIAADIPKAPATNPLNNPTLPGAQLITLETATTYAIPCPRPNMTPYVSKNNGNDIFIVKADRNTPPL